MKIEASPRRTPDRGGGENQGLQGSRGMYPGGNSPAGDQTRI